MEAESYHTVLKNMSTREMKMGEEGTDDDLLINKVMTNIILNYLINSILWRIGLPIKINLVALEDSVESNEMSASGGNILNEITGSTTTDITPCNDNED